MFPPVIPHPAARDNLGFSCMSRFDAILFDFDGVLIDSEPVHWACWADVLAGVGVALSWDYYRDNCIGIDDREMLRMMAGASQPARDWRELWELYPAKKKLFRERMESAPPFAAGLRELLDELAPEHKLAVVSSSSCTEIEPLLESAGLRRFFGTVVGGDSVERGRHKPAPDPYLLAAGRLAARLPLVVEDSEPGVASGRAAGFEVLRVPTAAAMPALVRTLAKTPPE
jgi:beta-phosphoglucomutase